MQKQYTILIFIIKISIYPLGQMDNPKFAVLETKLGQIDSLEMVNIGQNVRNLINSEHDSIALKLSVLKYSGYSEINNWHNTDLQSQFNIIDTVDFFTNEGTKPFEAIFYRFSVTRLWDGYKLFDGIYFSKSIFVNLREYCFYKKNVSLDFTNESMTNFLSILDRKYGIKTKDSNEIRNSYYLKWKNRVPSAFYQISKELKPDFSKNYYLSDLFESSANAIVSRSKYEKFENCNCENFDVVYLVQGSNYSNRPKKPNEFYWSSPYLIFDDSIDLIGLGFFSWENIDLH